MAKDRLLSLRRLLAVQQQRQSVQEWQLASLRQQHQSALDDLAALQAAASGTLGEGAFMADLVARRMTRQSRDLAVIEGRRDQKAAELLSLKRRSLPIVAALRGEEAEIRRRREAADLADIIERVVQASREP